jgi:nitroimidazol reductase NimA-like FMN-containing flavoprotein (pyridoxamine 5'-phosphate oxidase superfamily)
MKPIKITRPTFPPGYVDKPVSFLTWDRVTTQLTESKHYWICSVRPTGHPHVVPRWCVYVDGKIYYDGSPETRHAINIRSNPYVTVHLESGTEVIILEGTCRMAEKPSPELGKKLSQAYQKYKDVGYMPGPNSWDEGGLFVFTPRQCIAWSNFTENPTKFVLEEEEK